MDKPGLRDALPQPRQSDTRNDPFWSSLDSSLSATTPQPSEPVAKRDLDVGLGDVARGVGAGALDLVGGIGELARQASNFGKENAGKQGGDYLEQARANMANKLSPLLDVVAGAGDLAASGAESLNDGMSADAKEALGRRLVDETPEGRLTLGDGAGDIDVWAMKMAQGVGSLLPTLAAGGVTGVAAKASIGRAVTASMVKRGATQEVAEAVAAKAVSKIATGAAVTTGATGSVGSAGVNTRDTVLGMSFDELAGSDTFRQSFTRIDQDQQTAHLSDEEKLGLAREETANLASRATMSDAKVWGAAAMGSMMGDAMLFKMLAGKAATGGVLKGAAKGAAGEGISETLEEGVQQYAVNESLNEVAAADIDPMKGVMSSAIEGGLIGMGTGGAVGAVGGARGGKHASQEDGVGTDPVAEPSAPVTEDAAGPAVDPNFASVPLEDGEQAPSASQAEGELNPLGPSASQFPGVFERDQRGILRVKGDVDALASWAEQADMPYITDGDGIAIPAKYAKQAEKAIKGYRPVAAEPMAEAAPADMLAFSQVDPIEHEPAIKRQGFVMRNGDGQSTGEPEPYVRPQSGDELLYESSANWQAGQPHAESAPVDLEALRKESAQRWRDGNKPEAGTPVRTEEDTEQALNALRAEGVNGWAGRQDPKLDMPKGQEFIPHGPQAGLPAVVGDGVQQAAGKAKGLPLSDTIFAGGPSHGGQADNTNYARPHLTREQVDTSMGEQSTRDPRSPVAQSIAKAGSATDSVFGPLQSLRITRKGKPFATEKEAAMASRKDQEMPVPLNGGGFGVAAIGEVQQAQAQQGAVKQPSSNSAQQDRQDGKTEIAQNGMVIVHGSGNPGMSEQDIQIVRASGQKQGKKGRVYGGFYGTSEQDAHQAQAYADMMGGTPTLYDVKIKPGTKVLHKQGDITRLSESYINELVSQGYGVVTGTDPRGQTEHVVIDKSAVASMAPRGAQATPSQVNDTNVADIRQPSDQPAASVSAETVPAPSATAGEASQLAPAIDTGYREVIPVKQPKTEVSNEPVTPVPAISSEGQRDQPGAGEPAAAGAGPAVAGLTDRAGSGDRADLAAPAPVPDGQQQNDPTLTAPATDAGVSVSEVVQPEPVASEPAAAPTPWSEAIDNPDGTITLKGEMPAIKQWAKESGVKAIPGKGGMLVAKSSAAKVREYVAPATSEPVQQIEAARAEVAPEPTEAQKEAGNYKKGHLKLQGLDIALENPKGSTRSGTDQDGKAWQSTMAHDYGYIKRTQGADGDHVDVFIGDRPDSETVYVVDQVDPKTGKFDEHKVMMGFADEQAARDGYLANYEKGWKGLSAIKAMPMEEFKRWVKDGDTTKPIAASADAQGKISDFGEKIGGARKDSWAEYRDTVEGDTAEQIKALPLSKAWPAPDYDKLIESGVDQQAVAIARAARDAIPAKPRASYKVAGWADAVKHMRDMALGLLDGSIDVDKARRVMWSSNLRSSHAVMNRAELYQAVGHQRSLADLELSSGSYSLYDGIKYDPPKSIWTISRESKSSSFGNWPRTIASGASKAEVIAEFKRHYQQLTNQESKPKAVSFDIYSNDNRRSWIVGKKVGRNYLALTEPFEKVSDARQYRADNHDELVSKLGKAKEIPHERRDINQPRVGEDMRGGADVSPELFGEAFGFRGVEFGNWVEQGRRQQDLNNAYDALMDMAAVLGISPKALSLNGELGLAFGARGSGGVNPAAAHYEPGKVVINLTKMNGAGSLGHEWWHALDGYFARSRGQSGEMMTEARDVSLAARGSQFVHQGAVRKEMIEAFGSINRAIKQTSLKERSRKLDDKRSKEYWTTDRELSARAFESYLIAKLQDQNASNDYLANIVSEKSWDTEAALGMRLDGSYPYPTAGEIPAIRAGFDEFFGTIEEREEGDRRVLFSKQAMSQGEKPAKHLTRKEAELVTKEWFKQYRGASGIDVQIHATQAELEQALGLAAQDGLIRRAAFDDDSGTLHVAADTIANPKRMREILRHEVLAHYGLANVLGDGEYTKLMSRLIQSQKDPSMKPVWDWVNTHYADEDIGTQAEEVVAHLAELEQGAWGRGWDRVVAWVTRALRAVGFVPDGITAAETRVLIESLGKKMKRSGPDDSGPDGGKKFSQEAERPANDGGIKMSQSVADNSPSLEQSITQKAVYQAGAALGSVKNWMKQGRPVMLGTLTDLQIDQVYRDITGGAVSEYQRLRTQMEADRNDILLDAETRIDPLWDALGKQEKADLSNLMHDATMARLHPDKSLDENSYYQEAKQKLERAKKPETRAAYEAELRTIELNHSALAKQYNALPANAKELYGTMLDTYTKQWESLRGAIEQRLEDLLGLDQGRAMAAEMRQKMEHALQHGPYFPLTRYGDYVVKARKGDEYVREHFERRADAEQAVKQYQRDGYNAVMTVKEEGGGDSANANQLGMEMLSFLDSADGVSKTALKDEIWQAMLRMMPDASYAKHAIHRRRVKGASRDAHRGYLNSVYHYARHVSKIRYGHKMQGELDKLSEQIRAGVAGEPSSLKPEDLEIAQQVLNEMNKRHDLNMNPTGKAWAGAAGNIGFLYYIGPSVASAVVNMTQNFTVMLPQLGAKYGFAKSAAAMTKALGDYMKHGKFKAGTTEAWHSLTRSTTLPADERAILDRLYRAGALDLTQAHSIAAKADTDQQDAKPMGKRWRRAMRWAGATFHNAEVLNREVAALAAYRLLKQAEPTLDGQQYADRVAEMVYDGHGNYAASNRPRYMRNDITKVLTQFKIYSQMMTYVLYSNAIKAAKGDKVAAKTLGGVLATHWVMAGVMGLPTPITAVAYAIAAGLDDDDDRSGEASFRLALTEALGPRAGELLAKGPMDALTNLSIAGRTGLGDLWWRSPKEGTEGDDLAWHAVQQLLGPVAGIGINLARGAGQMTDGHIQRGLETMLPKSIRDVAKSYRQATEGEQTIKGDIIMDDVSTWNVAMQGLGFGSAQMAKNYDAREYIKGKEKRIADKRSQLLTDYYMARKSGEMDEVQEVLERIKMFNSIHHPRERITGKSLALSFKSKLRSNERTQGGVYLNRNREYLREEGRFAD